MECNLSELNQPLKNDESYQSPAIVISKSQKGSFFVRLFLEEYDKNIQYTSYSKKPKNIFLINSKNLNLHEGDFVIVKVKGSIVNQYIVNRNIGEKNNGNFIRKLEKDDYKKILEKYDVIIFPDKLSELENKKKELLDEIEQLEINFKNEDEKLKELNDRILKEISNLEKEKDKLLSFKQENQWLEQIKPYVVSNKNNSNNVDKIITKTKSKPLFNKITKLLKDRFNLSDDFIYCYLLSLFTSLTQGRFLLLTGHIGTGKSSIIKEIGKLLGGQTNMVAVRPAWLDASDLLGYFDPINNRYHSTDFVRFIKQENNDHINMVLLDEFNIARIENYGADILACFAEIGERNQEQNKIHLFNQDLQELIHTYQLFEELNDIQKQKYQHILDRIKQSSSIAIPDNVLICGTLNIDGSTENLSPKMIDRSFMLKFPDFDGQLGEIKEITEQVPLLISQMIDSVRKIDTISVQQWNDFYKTYIEKIKDSLIPISNRVAKDYLVFCQFAEFFGIDDEHKINALFFYARILPRLRIERLDDKNKDVLNSFKNNELFASFDREIKSGNNGNFIDYQHICG